MASGTRWTVIAERGGKVLILRAPLRMRVIRRTVAQGTLRAQLVQQTILGRQVRSPAHERGRLTQPATSIKRGRPYLAHQIRGKPSSRRYSIVLPARTDRRLLRAELLEHWHERSEQHRLEGAGHSEVMLGRASWKLTMTSRCKSGQRRYQGTFVAARRRSGRPGRRSAGSSPLREGAIHQSAASSEACRVATHYPARGQQGAEPGVRGRRPWKGSRTWKCNPDEPCGVEGVER
jgi:hypothetical protein